MQRREFFKGSAGLGVLSRLGFVGSPVAGLEGQATAAQDPMAAERSAGKIGRPVRVASISFRLGKPLREIAELVDKEGRSGLIS